MTRKSLIINANLLPATLEVVIQETEDAQSNIDLDTVIALEVANGQRPPTIRLWRDNASPGIVVSKRDIAGPLGQVAIDKVRDSGNHVFVRHTGGTAVPHTKGVLNVSIIFPRQAGSFTTDDYYRFLCKPQIDWLREYGVEADTGEVLGSYCDGLYNVIVGGKKLVGTAQSWRGGLAGMASRHPGYVLAHACMMVDVDLNWGMGLINQFYAWVGNDYRANPQTSTTLRTIAESFGVGLPTSSEAASKAFGSFLVDYFRNLGVQCI